MANEDILSTKLPSQFGDRFTVHNYTTSLAGATSAELLSSAQDLIKASSSRIHPELWNSVREPEPMVWVPRKSYAYNATPPLLLDGVQLPTPELKEWGAPLDESEQWLLAELEDFKSTDFSSVFMEILGRPLKRLSPDDPREDGPSTTKRRKLDEGPLHGVIARPHIYPSQQMDAAKRTATVLKPYRRTTPIMIPPYTHPLPQPSVYDRRAWMIPVRGTLPWKNTSPAEMLHDSETIPIPPAPRSLEPVVWSRKALQAFWEFLKILRGEGKLGTLGVSFHASVVYKKSLATASGGGGGGGQNTGPRSTNDAATYSSESAAAAVDYIKVYHDAVKSMVLRTAFDVWVYQVKDGDVEKIRVLKGAKLVLMDHMSRGMLIS